MFTCAVSFCLRAWRRDCRRSGLKTKAGPGRKHRTIRVVDLRPLRLLPHHLPFGVELVTVPLWGH